MVVLLDLEASSLAERIWGSRLVERSWIGSGAIPPVPYAYEQAFVAHRGEVAARYANAGKILRPNHPSSPGKCDRAFSQRRLRTALRSDPFSPIAFALPNATCRLSGSRKRRIGGKNGGFVGLCK